MEAKKIFIFIFTALLLLCWGDVLLTNYMIHVPVTPDYTAAHNVAKGLWGFCLSSWTFLLYYNWRYHRSCCAACLVDEAHSCAYDHDD